MHAYVADRLESKEFSFQLAGGDINSRYTSQLENIVLIYKCLLVMYS